MPRERTPFIPRVLPQRGARCEQSHVAVQMGAKEPAGPALACAEGGQGACAGSRPDPGGGRRNRAWENWNL